MNRFHAFGAGLFAVMSAASPASAQLVGCPYYQPGLIAFVTGVRPANCVYQGDYMVKQGPTYDGPAVVAPQPTYAPAPSTPPYMHGPYHAAAIEPLQPRAVVRRHTVRPVKRIVRNRTVVNVGSELPPPPRKGRPQIIKANAEVRIYGPERMDIRLYRR